MTDPTHPGRFKRVLLLSPPEPELALLSYSKTIAGPDALIHLAHTMTGSAGPDTALPSRDGIAARLGIDAARVQLRTGNRLDQSLACAAEIEADLAVTVCDAADTRRDFARRLAMKAPCSVLSVPSGASRSTTSILVPVDFSEQSADALAAACEIASVLGLASVTAIHVFFNEAVASYDEYAGVLAKNEDAAFHRFLHGVNLRGVRVDTVWEESGSVPHALHRAVDAGKHGLIVMGTRGRSRSAAVLLGSVTEQTIQESPVPVLAVKHFGARIGVLEVLLDQRFRHRDSSRFG